MSSAQDETSASARHKPDIWGERVQVKLCASQSPPFPVDGTYFCL